jgi:GntR family transcriptional regulator
VVVRLDASIVGNPPADTPKYVWLKRVLLDQIDRNLEVGDALPSERDLAEDLGVSRMTARRALSELMDEGRVSRAVGRGTFVAEPRIRLPIQLTSFTDDMTARGLTPGAHTISFVTGTPSGPVAEALDLEPGDVVHVVTRLRTADDVPMAIERVHLVASLAPDLSRADLENHSLYAYLVKRHGIVVDGGMETIRAKHPTAGDARLLQVAPRDAVLHLTRTSTWRGRVVEYTVSSYRGDRYELSTAI